MRNIGFFIPSTAEDIIFFSFMRGTISLSLLKYLLCDFSGSNLHLQNFLFQVYDILSTEFGIRTTYLLLIRLRNCKKFVMVLYFHDGNGIELKKCTNFDLRGPNFFRYDRNKSRLIACYTKKYFIGKRLN